MSSQPSRSVYARAMIGVFMVYALLFQAFFLGLTGSAQALDQHALCITDQAGLSERTDGAPTLPPHDCSCPALCHAAFVPPAPQALATLRIAHAAHFTALTQADQASRPYLAPSARGPPLAA